jgi:hypothetical protein
MKRQQLEKRQRRQAIQRFYQDQAELLNEKIDTERKMRAVQEKVHSVLVAARADETSCAGAYT